MTGTPAQTNQSRVAYTVRAVHPDRASAERYIAWLTGGHIQGVIAGGAESGVALDLDSDDGAHVVEARYVFGSRSKYDQYVAEHAPKLREEGLALFGPQTGVVMTRTLGEVHEPA